jgi:thiamine-monophosphate kinase
VTGEFATIRRLVDLLPPPRPGAVSPGEVWIGDDAAALRTPQAPWLLLAADAVVAGVHADLALTTLEDLGWKAIAVNLSDIAAMGGTPRYALVTVAGDPAFDLDALYRGIAAAVDAFGCPVVGGDLSNGPGLVVGVSVTGTTDTRPVRRSGAAPADGIWVTGPLGASAAGLRVLRAGPPAEGTDALVAAHARPVPRLREGLAAAAAGATAMIDVSDGLAADLGHIADASGLGYELHALPVADGATVEEALGGGEDYELVFCAPDTGAVEVAFDGLAAPIRIGRCVPDRSRRLWDSQPIDSGGWQHRW